MLRSGMWSWSCPRRHGRTVGKPAHHLSGIRTDPLTASSTGMDAIVARFVSQEHQNPLDTIVRPPTR
jgi:hypothetical protein